MRFSDNKPTNAKHSEDTVLRMAEIIGPES